MKRLVLSLIFLMLSCALINPKPVMNSWVGAHQSELIASWGPPARTVSDGRGGTILIYEATLDWGQTEGEAYVDALGRVHYTNPKSRTTYHYRMFYVNSNGYIYHWKAR